MIKSIDPCYDELKEALDKGPCIKSSLYQNSLKKWQVTLLEVWPSNITYTLSTETLDKRVDWTTELLQDWKGVRRTAWDSWSFLSKKDAERFLIIYGLTWNQ
jgi:hypothetical protein